MASDSFGIFTNTLAAYYGIARVALDRIRFDEIAPDARTVDPDAVTRLLLKFTDGRCDRLAPNHYMSATVSEAVLTRALDRGNITRVSLQSPEPYFLPLTGDEHVMGIRGIHRYKAAQQYFSDDQWWVVRLYDERVLSDMARRSIAWSSVMVAPGSSGEVYRQIRLAHHRQDWDWKMEWENAVRPAYLQSDMSRLQTGPEHQPLRDALDQLLCFPGLWMDWHMPLFRGLGALCCMESLVSFLHVVKARLSNILYGLNPHHLDVGTIRLLQGRCPALSDRDRREIEAYMTQKRVFPNVVDAEERECLKQRLLAQNTIILSLGSWKDAITHYLRPGASILKPLFNLSFHKRRARSERVRSSIQREARASFRPGRVPAMRPSSGSAHEDFWDAYRRLWVAAMDHLLDIEQEPGCATLGLQDMARIAYALGFSSDSIRQYVCEAGCAPVGMGSGRPPSSRLRQIRSPSLPRHLRNLRASRDRLTFDQVYLQRAAGKTDETLAEFEIFRDALRSFFPNLPPMTGPSRGHGGSKLQSAPFEPTGLDISAFIEELNHHTLEDNFPASGEVYHLSPLVSRSTDSGSFYSRDTSGEARSSTEAPDSRFSDGQRHSQYLLSKAQRASGTSPNPERGLRAVECTQAPHVVQRAMHRANGVWIYHDASPPMLYKLPPPRARRIFIHTIAQREPDHWYAILDENGAFQRVPRDRAIELLGVKLIIYGQSRSVDPFPNVDEILDLAPRQVQPPDKCPASSQATEHPWNWI